MQILQWLFRTPHDACEKDEAVITRLRIKHQTGACCINHILSRGAREAARSSSLQCRWSSGVGNSSEDYLEGDEDDGTLTVVLSGDNSGTCSYGTLKLKHLRSILCRSSSSPWPLEGGGGHVVRRMGQKAAPESSSCSSTVATVRWKVLPFCDAPPSACSSNAGCSGSSSL